MRQPCGLDKSQLGFERGVDTADRKVASIAGRGPMCARPFPIPNYSLAEFVY